MRTAIVGRDKNLKRRVNRHLPREKESKFLAKLRERKPLPQNELSEINWSKLYLDGVKYIMKFYWDELDTIVFWLLPKGVVDDDMASWKYSFVTSL